MNAPNILRDFPDGVTEEPRVGSTELWEIVNLTMDAHPIHTHLVQFQILNRQSLDVDGTMGSKDPSGHGYIGFDDGINTPIPGAWALAFGSPLPHGCDGADPLNPCPGFGPPLKYDSGEKINLANGPASLGADDDPRGRVAAGPQSLPVRSDAGSRLHLALPHPRPRGQRHDAAV